MMASPATTMQGWTDMMNIRDAYGAAIFGWWICTIYYVDGEVYIELMVMVANINIIIVSYKSTDCKCLLLVGNIDQFLSNLALVL